VANLGRLEGASGSEGVSQLSGRSSEVPVAAGVFLGAKKCSRFTNEREWPMDVARSRWVRPEAPVAFRSSDSSRNRILSPSWSIS